jgi:hypothetical protein
MTDSSRAIIETSVVLLVIKTQVQVFGVVMLKVISFYVVCRDIRMYWLLFGNSLLCQ